MNLTLLKRTYDVFFLQMRQNHSARGCVRGRPTTCSRSSAPLESGAGLKMTMIFADKTRGHCLYTILIIWSLGDSRLPPTHHDRYIESIPMYNWNNYRSSIIALDEGECRPAGRLFAAAPRRDAVCCGEEAEIVVIASIGTCKKSTYTYMQVANLPDRPLHAPHCYII